MLKYDSDIDWRQYFKSYHLLTKKLNDFNQNSEIDYCQVSKIVQNLNHEFVLIMRADLSLVVYINELVSKNIITIIYSSQSVAFVFSTILHVIIFSNTQDEFRIFGSDEKYSYVEIIDWLKKKIYFWLWVKRVIDNINNITWNSRLFEINQISISDLFL